MVWRLPSREIGGVPYEEGLELPPEYITRDPEFDAIDELSRDFNSVKLPMPRPTSSDYGAYLHRQKKRQTSTFNYHNIVHCIETCVDSAVAGGGGTSYQHKLKPVGNDVSTYMTLNGG